MAIDNRLSLAAQPTNLQAAITGGLDIGEKIRNKGVRDAILRQQEQLGAQNIQQNKVIQEQQKSSFMNDLATGLKSVPVANRAAIISQKMPMMKEMGFNPADILSQGLTDNDLDQVIAGTRESAMAKQQPTAGMQDFQFYQSIISDPRSTPEQVQAAKIQLKIEPGAGRGQIKEVSPGVFQSFDPNTNAFGPVYKVQPDGTQVPLTREEQRGLTVSEQAKTIAQLGGAETDVAVSEAQQLSDIAVEEQRIQSETTARVQRGSALKSEYSTKARQSASSAVKLSEALQLAKVSDQGLTGTGKLYLSRVFPGMDISNEVALDSALLGLALDGLQQFKGPTTDFEFGIVQSISGSLLGSAKANQARISSLQRNNWFVQEEFNQFNDWVDAGEDPDRFRFNFNKLITVGKGDKEQDITLQDLQETAVHYGISIDEALATLNR